MIIRWLKKTAPRSLYGRAAVILLMPIVFLQLVVSIVFIQDHFEDVTFQLSRSVGLELQHAVSLIEHEQDIGSARALLDDLKIEVIYPAKRLVTQDRRRIYDLSGRVVLRSLHDLVDSVSGIDLAHNLSRVHMSIDTRIGPVELQFSRFRVSASNPHQLLVVSVLTAVFLSLISVIFLRNQLRPIKRLGQAAQAFGRGQHVTYRISGAREVRAVGTAFVEMRRRIERQIEQRTLMLSGVSHDLRTPLTRMKLALDLLPPGEERDGLHKDVEEMSRMLNGYLEFAKGDALDDLVETDLAALLDEMVVRYMKLGQPVSFEKNIAIEPLLLRAMAIRRALDNLISNALRYGSCAQISLVQKPTQVWIIIQDDGPGIAPAQYQAALKPFTQLDHSRNQNRGGGVGLGLAIAQDIARQHGGGLRLSRSETLGGLCVTMILPT